MCSQQHNKYAVWKNTQNTQRLWPTHKWIYAQWNGPRHPVWQNAIHARPRQRGCNCATYRWTTKWYRRRATCFVRWPTCTTRSTAYRAWSTTSHATTTTCRPTQGPVLGTTRTRLSDNLWFLFFRLSSVFSDLLHYETTITSVLKPVLAQVSKPVCACVCVNQGEWRWHIS